MKGAGSAGPSTEVALSAMRSLKPYMQDIGVVYRLLETQLG